MNRIRQAYVRMRPAAAPFLILGTTDDVPGITRSFGPLAGTYSFAHFFVTIPGMIVKPPPKLEHTLQTPIDSKVRSGSDRRRWGSILSTAAIMPGLTGSLVKTSAP